jgi:hypothetical protein
VFVTNVDKDRDQAIERVLTGALRARAADAASDACLDAETAAAWTDGALSREERSMAEAHAAGCARCQALLAALVRTSPPAPARSRFRVPTLAWVAPLTAAAAALIVWMILPPRARLVPADRAASTTDVPTTPSAAPPAASAPPAPQSLVAGTPAEPKREARSSEQRKQVRTPAFADGSRGSAAAAAAAAPAAAPATPLPSAANKAAADTPASPVDQKAAGAAPGRAAAPLSALAETVLTQRLNSVQEQTLIISTTPRHRWLIAADGVVLRSIDGGSTWEAQRTGASVTLTAGASPAPSICWLVGPGGIVLLSTDGRSWQALPFPEKVDLVAVRATDDRSAAVTAAGGRTFSTTDRGVTWTPLPNR